MKAVLIIILGILSTNLIVTYYICTMIRVPFDTPGGYSEYSLIIEDEDELKIEWDYKTLNHSLVDRVLNETDVELDLSAYHQGDVITWDVSIKEDSECESYYYEDGYYREIVVYEHVYLSNHGYSLISKDYKIKMYPEAYAGNMLCGDDDYTNKLVPIQVYDFLPAVEECIPGFKLRSFYDNNTEYIITSNSILKVFTTNTTFVEEMTYNGDGILRYHSITYENQTVMELYLVKYHVHDYIHTYPEYERIILLRRLALGAFVATLISILLMLIVLFAVGKSSKKDDLKKFQLYPQDNNNTKADSGKNIAEQYSKIQFCSNCRTLIEAKAAFCHNCGQEVHREIRFCQYCGHLNLKSKKYCTDCGHIF